MELAKAALASLAPKLGKLLEDEYGNQTGLEDKIVMLSTEFATIHAVLDDASRVPMDQLTEVDKLWVRQARELSYEIEDVVDDFILRVVDAGCESDDVATDANVFNKIFSKIPAVLKTVKDRHQISGKVKDIKRLSNELASIHAKYAVRGVGAIRATSTGIDPRVINLYKKESDLVGIEETKDKVIRMLMGNNDYHAHASDQSLKIVSIVGVGGLGKTTLAKTVHDKLKKQFECYAFVSVGRTPELPRILENMLGKLDAKYKNRADMARWDKHQFLEELQIFLQHKRYASLSSAPLILV